MQEFERRIAALEAEVLELRGDRRRRSYPTVAIAALALCGLGLSRGSDRSTFEVLQTRKLVLTDAEGSKQGELYTDKEGAGRLELYGPDPSGPERAPFASLASHRGGGQLDLANEGGTTATLGAGFGETWGGFLRLASEGYPVVSLWTQDGTANLQMIDSDEEGGFLCGTRSVSSGRAGWMELRNGKGEPALYLLSGEKGEGVVELYDERGEARTLRTPAGSPEDDPKEGSGG